MSIDDQDRMLGRLTRQNAECGRTIAALEVQCSLLSKKLREAADRVAAAANPAAFGIDDAMAAATEIPATPTIVAALKELEAERKRGREIADQLIALKP